MLNLKYIREKLNKNFENDPDGLNKVRANFLLNTLFLSIFVALFTLPGFWIKSFDLLFYRSLAIVVVQSFFIWVIINLNKWKLVAHLLCIMLALIILTNFFTKVQGVELISLQFILLLVTFSYYLLGKNWGIIYSILSATSILFYSSSIGKQGIQAIERGAINDATFYGVIIFNFLLIFYIQYHFFNAFSKTINSLETKELEGRILNEKLSVAMVEIKQTAKAKSDFLSTISHELRTPLNAVIGMSNILLLENPRPDQQENLNILKFSGNNLLALINDILDINKIDSGKIELEKIPFKISVLVEDIFRSFKGKALAKGLQLTLDVPDDFAVLVLNGDPTRLTQILNNLIDNAIKFTVNGKVNFLIKTIKKSKESVILQFTIIDTGIGIPLDKQKLIFDSFSQASTSSTREYGGTGLGLAIVKNLLALHNSDIITRSEVGVGTSFEFRITYNINDANMEQANATPHNFLGSDSDISKLRILIAEDDQMNTLLMRKLLAKWQLSPDFVNNGLEAVDACKANTYDLILMDIHMPKMDGYEATTIIRSLADKSKAELPIIALTASVALDVRHKIAEVGITDFISKPFKPNELRAKLEAIAGSKK